MITVNPVHFLSIERKKRYIVNPQYLAIASHPPAILTSRRGCILAPLHLKMNQIPGNSTLTFKCITPNHKARFCASISPLKLTRAGLSHHMTSAGNALLEIFSRRCHACGEHKNQCWREYTGHFICNSCVVLDRGRAPYVYGMTKTKCCVGNKCGRGIGLFSESGHVLFSKAVAIYERYSPV